MRKKDKISEFVRQCREEGMTYAQGQILETSMMMAPIIVPPGYSKIGERQQAKKKEKRREEQECWKWV